VVHAQPFVESFFVVSRVHSDGVLTQNVSHVMRRLLTPVSNCLMLVRGVDAHILVVDESIAALKLEIQAEV